MSIYPPPNYTETTTIFNPVNWDTYIAPIPTLKNVLLSGNSAGTKDIDMNSQNITNATAMTATTFNGALNGNANTATSIKDGTSGDILYQSASNTTAKLPIGVSTYILTSNGSTPTWSPPAVVSTPTLSNVLVSGNSAGSNSINMNSQDITNGGSITSTTFNGALNGNASSSTSSTVASNVGGGVNGDLLYQTGTSSTTKLPIGASTYILSSNGTVPVWTAPAVVSIPTLANVLLAGNSAGATSINMNNNITNASLVNGLQVSSGVLAGNINIGVGNLNLTTTGNANNVAIGTFIMNALTSGDNNNCIGNRAGEDIATGSSNNAMGANALTDLTTGNYNIAVGNRAGQKMNGNTNVFLGNQAGQNQTIGNDIICIGSGAGQNSSGNSNTYLGSNSSITGGATNSTVLGQGATTGIANTIQLGRTVDNVNCPNTLSVAGAITATGGVLGNASSATTASACSGNSATATTATNANNVNIGLTYLGTNQVVPLINTSVAVAGNYPLSIGTTYNQNILFDNTNGMLTCMGITSTLTGNASSATTATNSNNLLTTNTATETMFLLGSNSSATNTGSIYKTTGSGGLGLYYLPSAGQLVSSNLALYEYGTSINTSTIDINAGVLEIYNNGNPTPTITKFINNNSSSTPRTVLELNGNAGASTFDGNALTATTASACSGNSATATTASACSGNSATATTASACSGNSATATLATTATTSTNSTITNAASGTQNWLIMTSNSAGNIPLKTSTTGATYNATTNLANINIGLNAATATTASTCSGNAVSADTALNITGGLGGQVLYQSAVNTTAKLTNGTAGQVLQSNGTTLAPSWTSTVSALTSLTTPIIQNVNSGSAGLTIRNQASNTGNLNIQQLGNGSMTFSTSGITNLTLQQGYTTFENAIRYATNLTALSGTADLSLLGHNINEFYLVNATSAVSIILPSPLSSYGCKITFRRSAGASTITFTTDQTDGPNLEIVAFNTVNATTTATMTAAQYTSTFYCNASLWYQAVY